MQLMKFSMAALLTLTLSGITTAEEYKVSGVHNCCGKCCTAIVDALKSVEGISDIEAKPKVTDVSFSAPDAKTARKAINKLGLAGFHGTVTTSGGKNVKIRDNSQVEAGKVETLTLVGVHNCCGGCAKAVDDAIAKVEGVESHKYTKNKKGVILTGNFDGQAVVKSLNEAGFHVRKPGKRKIQQKVEQKTK